MAHHVRAREAADGDVVYALQHAHGLLEAAHLVAGQVYLRHVAGYDHARAEAYAREEHLHLLAGGVLCLVEDDKAVVQRAPAHVGQGRDLYVAALEVLVIGVRAQHLKERVVERAQVGVNLALQIAGQEAEALARLHGGARQYNAVDLFRAEGADRLGHGQIGLAGARGAYAERDGVLGHGVHIGLLAQRLGLDGLALGRDADHVPAQLAYLGLAALTHELEDVAHVLRVDNLAAAGQLQQAVYGLLRGHDVLRLAGNAQLVVPVRDRHMQLALYNPQVLVKAAEDADDVLHAVNRHCAFYHMHQTLSFVFCHRRPASPAHAGTN